MVAINTRAPERGAHLNDCYQLTDELARVSTFAEGSIDEDPADPSREEQALIDEAVALCCESIRRAKPRPRAGAQQTFRVDPASAALAKRMLQQGSTKAAVRAETGLGRKALETIQRGELPRALNVNAGAVRRCGDCGRLITTEACLACVSNYVDEVTRFRA